VPSVNITSVAVIGRVAVIGSVAVPPVVDSVKPASMVAVIRVMGVIPVVAVIGVVSGPVRPVLGQRGTAGERDAQHYGDANGETCRKAEKHGKLPS
jgi:hypothetical protein